MSTQMIKRAIADYFKTQPVVKAWLFGSFARGEETPLSDVDILVVLDHSQPIGLKFFGMWNAWSISSTPSTPSSAAVRE